MRSKSYYRAILKKSLLDFAAGSSVVVKEVRAVTAYSSERTAYAVILLENENVHIVSEFAYGPYLGLLVDVLSEISEPQIQLEAERIIKIESGSRWSARF